MYCQKCGTENLGDAQVCVGCGGVFVRSIPARTSAMAITSMILGISGFSLLGIFGITWIIGLIFGIIALQKISKSSGRIKGRGWALTGIITSATGLALVLTILGVWLVFTSVHTVKLKKQVVELKRALIAQPVEGVPSIAGIVKITDTRAEGSTAVKKLFDPEIAKEDSIPIVNTLGCGPADAEPTAVSWRFAGKEKDADIYEFIIAPASTIADVAEVIEKRIIYDGSEQIIYQGKNAEVIISPNAEDSIQ